MAKNPSGLGSARRRSEIMRVMERLVVQQDGCCTWPGRLNHGYGQVGWRRQTRPVHRVIYEHFVGTVPEGKELDHVCKNRACSNFAHLELVTPQENTRRSDSIAGRYARRIHCDRGHPLSGQNLRERIHGGRHRRDCRICAAEAARKSKARQRERRIALEGEGSVRHYPDWSAGDDDLLRRLFGQGMNDIEIAAALDRTVYGVTSRRGILALYRRCKYRTKLTERLE